MNMSILFPTDKLSKAEALDILNYYSLAAKSQLHYSLYYYALLTGFRITYSFMQAFCQNMNDNSSFAKQARLL